MDATIQNEQKLLFIELGAIGAGGIQSSPDQLERLDEVTNRVGSGEFHVATKGTIPTTCIDGRFGSRDEPMPNAAGGSESLMVADDLTAKRFASGTMTTYGQYKAMLASLQTSGYPIGGHTAVDCHGAPSGCGANDKLAAIYAYISENADTLRGLATELLEYEIDDTTHAMITGHARERAEFSDGGDLLTALRENNGRIDMLEGEHTEVVAVINRRPGTTLDRDAVRAVFGDSYEAFNVDEWAFAEGARVVSGDGNETEAQQKRIAMLYYNLATAGVLCGPGMRVVVLR